MTGNKKAELNIAGTVCAAYTPAIEKALRSLDGVAFASVSLGMKIASVEYDSEKLRLADLEKTIRDVGYDVIDEKGVLKIGGMVCAMCIGALEIALKKLDGGGGGACEPGFEKAYFTFNPSMVGLEDIRKLFLIRAVNSLASVGEEALVDREKEALQKNLADKKKCIIIGFATNLFLMALMYLPVHKIASMQLAMAVPNFMSLFMLIASAPVVVYLSHSIFRAALRAFANRNLDMDVMYSMSIGVAYGFRFSGPSGLCLQPASCSMRRQLCWHHFSRWAAI